MKIVIATSRPFHLVHLARELSAMNNSVTVIGYMPKWKMKNYELGSAKYISLFWALFPFSILALQRYNSKVQKKSTFYIMPVVDYLISVVMPPCDIFIGLSGVNLRSFEKAKKIFNAITICDRGSSHINTQHDNLNDKIEVRYPNLYINRELKGYQICDYIMLPSEYALNSFLKKGVRIEKLIINNYGVNLSRFNRAISKKILDSNNINALYVGGWNYWKGCDLLCEAVNCNEKLTITHIGNSGGLEFPKHKRIKTLGHISNKELNKHYCNYDVFILPTRDDGFGMVLLEALASGLPVVTSKNSGGPDIKVILNDNNCVEILDDLTSKSINKVLLNNSFLSKEVKLDKNDIDYFTWESYGKRYNEILEKLKTRK